MTTYFPEHLETQYCDLLYEWFITKYGTFNFDAFSNAFRILPLDFIEKHITEKWDWVCISMCPNLTLDFLVKYSKKPWSWKYLTRNSEAFSLTTIENNIRYPWSWKELSYRDDVTIEFVSKHWKQKWYWYGLSVIIKFNELELEDVFDIAVGKNKISKHKWELHQLCINSSIKPNQIIKYFKKHGLRITSFMMKHLSQNSNLCDAVLIENLDLDWNWLEIVNTGTISFEVIEMYMETPSYTSCVPICRTYTPTIIEKWHTKFNHTLWYDASIEIDLEYFHKTRLKYPWNYEGITCNLV